MTTQTETVKAPEGPAKAGPTLGFIFTTGIAAILVWVSGVALNRGFGVHLPFVAGLMLVLAGLQVVKLAANEVAHSWHAQATAAASRTAAAAVAGAYIAQAEIEAAQDAGVLKQFIKGLQEPTDTDNGGAYL